MTYVARNIPEDFAATLPEEKKADNPASGGRASFFSQVSPKSALAVGLITSILTACTIGFVVLLIIFLKGGQ